MKLDLQEIETYLRVVELGGVSRAAEDLALSKSVISKRLSDLEKRLGSKLLHRSTRKITPTDTGLAFYQQAKQALLELSEAAEAAAALGDCQPGGAGIGNDPPSDQHAAFGIVDREREAQRHVETGERLARFLGGVGNTARPAWKSNERPYTTDTRESLLTHDSDPLPVVELDVDGDELLLRLPRRWLEGHPLTRLDLEGEREILAGFGRRLEIRAI